VPEQIDPTPDEIEARAKEVREKWTDEVREQRSAYKRLPACIHNYRFCKQAKTFVAGSCPDAEIPPTYGYKQRLEKAGVW
jgi:hypothetical protein